MKFFYIFFLSILFLFTVQKISIKHKHTNRNKLSKEKRKLKVLKKELHHKKKKVRKLFADAVLKIIERSGVKSLTHDLFKQVYGGITTIKMAKEDPFLVVNTYPINQYVLPSQQEDHDLTNMFKYGNRII